jgi:3-hydroxyisobutyrate dehydrogenase-like beta-hydroxyacid dehydrogenase
MINHVLTGEVLALAKAVGLDRSITVDLLQNTADGRGQLGTNFPRKVLKGDTSADFSVDMGIKDLSMSISMLKEFQDMASFGPIARNHFKEAAREGYGVKDCTAILEYFDEKISNIAN